MERIAKFTQPEQEELVARYQAAQAAQAELDKWLEFLRRQHTAPDGAQIRADGFYVEGVPEVEVEPDPDNIGRRRKQK